MNTMQSVAVVLAATAVGTLAAPSPDELYARHGTDNQYSFQHWIKEYGEDTSAFGLTHSEREHVFNKEYAHVMAHNADPSQTYKKGINRFSGYTDAEFKDMMLLSGYNAEARSHDGHLGAHGTEDTLVVNPSNATLPTNVDWRACGPYSDSELCPLSTRPSVPIVTSIKSQGRCGSCWAFASTATLESHLALYAGKHYALAPQHAVSCAPNTQECGGVGGCQGSTADVYFKWANQTGGVASASVYGYLSGTDGQARECDEKRAAQPFASVSSTLGKPLNNNYFALMNAVVTYGPVAINVDASKWRNYHSGVYTDCGYDNPDGVTLNHVVVLEGYGVDNATGLSYFLVRNSWGPLYGESGYIRLVRETDGQRWAVDNSPADGWDCKPFPKQVIVSGCNGLAYQPTFPTGVRVADGATF